MGDLWRTLLRYIDAEDAPVWSLVVMNLSLICVFLLIWMLVLGSLSLHAQ